MNTVASVNRILISSTKNAPIIKLESKKTVPFEELTMTKREATTTEAEAVALNIATVQSNDPRLANGLDSLLSQAYKQNRQIMTNQILLAQNNQAHQLPADTLRQISNALDKTLAAVTPAKNVEQNNHTPASRRPR